MFGAIHLDQVPEGQAIQYVSKYRGVPCESIFLAAAGKAVRHKLPANERLDIFNFAKAACKTKNPDIVWQIAYVESSFQVKIVRVAGNKILVGKKAEEFLNSNISPKDNIDIGPLQINWRENGAKICLKNSILDNKNGQNCKPADFLSGDFSVNFLSNKILRMYVNTCGENWINCYHSYNKGLGWDYRKKIYFSGLKLREVLSTFMG